MDPQTIHNALIILHAASATVAFFAGCLLISSPTYSSNRGVFSLYWWSLIAMAILLAGAILVYWTQYSTVERIIFPGLLLLAIYMLYRAQNAGRLLNAGHGEGNHEYSEHIGFTLISLFEGFIIVSGLNSGFPGWLVAIVAVLGVFAGRWLIGFSQRRLA